MIGIGHWDKLMAASSALSPSIITHADYVGQRGWIFESVCLFVCPEHNSKINDPKVFKLGTGNYFGLH